MTKAFGIVEELLNGIVYLPGLRDSDGRSLLIYPKSENISYEDFETVSSYLITIPKKSVLNKGIVVIIDATDNGWERIKEIFLVLKTIQGKNPGRVVLIHVIVKPNYKTQSTGKIKSLSGNIGTEFKVHTSEEFSSVLPPTSTLTLFGGKVSFDNEEWVKFRMNVEPFLGDCKSMGRRLEEIVRPLTDVEQVISDCNHDVKAVSNKYTQLTQQTMRNLHLDSLLFEGAQLIERYKDKAQDFPGMLDTIDSISAALANLRDLQQKVEHLATVGQERAEHTTAYLKFRKSLDNVISDIRTHHNQLMAITPDGIYDVHSVEQKQQTVAQIHRSYEGLKFQVTKIANEGTGLVTNYRVKAAERDVVYLQNAWSDLNVLYGQRRDLFNEFLNFHQTVEDCMKWYFSGIHRYTVQPVESCNTLEGICDLEQELDRHLSRCPIKGYSVLDTYATTIGNRHVTSRVKMIKAKFAQFEKTIIERQEYLRKLKFQLINRHRNDNRDVEAMTGLHYKKSIYDNIKFTQSTQFDIKDIFGIKRNKTIQTSLACACTQDRLAYLAERLTAVENRLNITNRTTKLEIPSSIKEQLSLILRRIGVIESCLKRLRFSSIYDGFYKAGPRVSSKSSNDILNDLQNTSMNDSGFISHGQDATPHSSLGLSSRSTPCLTPNTIITTVLSEEETPTNTDNESDQSGRSTPATSVRQYFRNQTTSPISPGIRYTSSPLVTREESDISRVIRNKLADVERLLIDIEHEVSHDLKVDEETQTTDVSFRVKRLGVEVHTDSSSQTETESEATDTETQTDSDGSCSDVGVQKTVPTINEATQFEHVGTDSKSTEAKTPTTSMSSGTDVTFNTTSAQSDPVPTRQGVSQTPTTQTSTNGSQYTAFSSSIAVQSEYTGVSRGEQASPVLSSQSSQYLPNANHGTTQTELKQQLSSYSQVDYVEVDGSSQTEMIGLFPASVQTTVTHYAAKACQAVPATENEGVGTCLTTRDQSESADVKSTNHKDATADIKSDHHKLVEANIKSDSHKGVSAVAPTRTQGTAARVMRLLSRGTDPMRPKNRQVEVQVQPETKTITLDTIELFDVRSTTTDTDTLIMCDNGSTQTSLFDPVLINTPTQTEVDSTLLSSPVYVKSWGTQTEPMVEVDGSRIRRSRSGLVNSRSETHLNFRDVSYNKNRTHELRVAQLRKNQEKAQEVKGRGKKKKKKLSSTSSLEDPSKLAQDNNANKSQDIGKEEETKNDNDQTLKSEEHISEEEPSDEEDWAVSSYVFPIEEAPSPISEKKDGLKYNITATNLPTKLQYVLQEMLETEENYVDDLRHVVESYLEPMEQHPDPAINNLGEEVFGKFLQIFGFHQNTFKDSLITSATSQNPLCDVAATFTRHELELSVYMSYMIQERQSHAAIERNKDGFIKELEAKSSDRLGLSAYLIKPTQRMVKYKQFLDIMLEKSEDFESIEDISEAQTLVTNILSASNDLCHLQALQKPDELTEEVTGEFLKQAEFTVNINNGPTKRRRRVFLFENKVIFSKEDIVQETKEPRYRIKEMIGMEEIGLTPYVAAEPLKCQIWTPEEIYSMQAESPAVAETWSKAISNILWGQLKQIKRDRDMSRLRKNRTPNIKKVNRRT